MPIFNNQLAGASAQGSLYTIDQSIRFNDDDTAYMSRTPGAAESDLTRATVSVWYKRGVLGTSQTIFSAGASGNATWFGFTSANVLGFFQVASSTTVASISTNAVFRDPSAWYHIVCTYDSNEAASADRLTITVNGIEQSVSTAVAISSGRALDWNSTDAHSISRRQDNASEYCDGYLAEFVNIPASALAATSFAEYNDDGVWVPKKYTGTYGTNGFYLKGQDSAALGDDSSGNGNDFTSSGLTSDDQRADTPTNNLMTFNPLNNMRDDGDPTDGNRIFKNTGSTRNLCGTTFHFNTGKYVQAFSASAITSNIWQIGTMPSDEADVNDAPGSNEDLNAGVRIQPLTNYYVGGTGATTNTGIAADANDTYWVAMDLDAGKQWVGIYDDSDSTMKWFDSSAGTTGDPAAGSNPTSTVTANDSFNFAVCGRSSVELTLLEESEATGTVPTGFTYVGALQDTYATPAIADGSAYFNTLLYTASGTSTGYSVTGVGFQPDFVLGKNRTIATRWTLFDAVRGATEALFTDRTDAETTLSTALISFDADGFTFGTDTTSDVDRLTDNYVTYNWLAANGTASNSDGDITSTVSANTTAGCSVIGYTGNATSGATIGHGLGVAPAMVITKSRSSSSYHWYVYHQSNGATKYMRLNDTSAVFTDTNAWNNTAPTSSVITLGNSSGTNHTGTMIAYAFAEVEGFSKFGTYTGNGSTNGPFAYCGFRPAFVMVKRTNSADNWAIVDSSRNPYNVANLRLYPDTSNADITSTTHDFLSNGFKLRASDGGVNGSGSTYIFMAFAENPFGGDGVAPVPAR